MSIENTTNRAPIEHIGGMLCGTDSYITGMEAAGQQQLVNSTLLPAQGDWGEAIALGVVKGNPVADDPLFVHVALPDGWSRAASDHAMQSYILDERGVRRIGVFYKAAFYDRRANFHVIANPGWDLGGDAIYGGQTAALPEQWPLLTADEKAGFIAALADYMGDAKRNPEIYADRLPRVRQIRRLAADAIGLDSQAGGPE